MNKYSLISQTKSIINKLNRDKKRCSSEEELCYIKQTIKYHLKCLRIVLRNKQQNYVDYFIIKYKDNPWSVIRKFLKLDLDFQNHSLLPNNIHKLEADFLDEFVSKFSTSSPSLQPLAVYDNRTLLIDEQLFANTFKKINNCRSKKYTR
jgi:hypothetical protein